MGLLGLFSKKEVAEKEKQAKETLLQQQQSSLANLAKGSQVKFSIPFFDVFDPRFENFAVPVSVHGTLVYAIEDMGRFSSINKTQNVNDGVFEQKMRGQLGKYIKAVVTNAPSDNNIQVLQMERKILEISDLVQRLVTPKIEQLFAINVRSFDISQIIVDKDSPGYRELRSVTSDIESSNIRLKNSINEDYYRTQSAMQLDAMRRQQELNLSGQEEMQRMQLENQRETMRIQREEMQRAARLQTETNFMGAHQANLNAEVGKVGNMFGQHSMGYAPSMQEEVSQVQYMVAINGQQIGPCDWSKLQQMVQQGLLTHNTYVWKQGMANWELAVNVRDMQTLFASLSPQMPKM